MNIQFTIIAHGLEKAAAVEKALKSINATFESQEYKTKVNGKRQPRRHVTKAEVVAVVNELQSKGIRSFIDIAKACNVHPQTVSKIAKGVHPLLKEVKNETSIQK